MRFLLPSCEGLLLLFSSGLALDGDSRPSLIRVSIGAWPWISPNDVSIGMQASAAASSSGEGLDDELEDDTLSLSVSVVPLPVVKEQFSSRTNREPDMVTEEMELIFLLLPCPWPWASSALANIGFGTIESEAELFVVVMEEGTPCWSWFCCCSWDESPC